MATVKQLEDIVDSVKAINKSLLDDLLTLKEDKKLTNVQLNAALTAREKAETKYSRMKKELEETIKKSEDQQASFGEIENELSKLKKEFERCNEELIESKKKIEEMDGIIKVLHEEKKKLEETLKGLEEVAGNVADRDKNIDVLTKENRDLIAKVSHYEAERSKYEKIKSEESKKRIEAEQYAVGLEKRAQELEERIDREAKSAKETKDQSRSSVEEIKVLLEKEKKERKEIEDELNEYKTLFEREQSNREKIEEDTTAMKKQQATFEKDLKSEKTKAAELESEVIRLKQQLQKKELESSQLVKLLDREKETNTTLEEEWNREKILFKTIKLDLENQLHQLSSTLSNNHIEISNTGDKQSSSSSMVVVVGDDDNEENHHRHDDGNDNNSGITIHNQTSSSSASTTSAEKMYLKEWEERLEKQSQQIKNERLEIEGLKRELLISNSGSATNGDGNHHGGDLELRLDELTKALEGERKVRIKLEEQLQQLHPSSNNSGSSSVPPSPSKGVTNTISSLFSRRNLSIPDFSYHHNNGSKSNSNGSTSPPLPSSSSSSDLHKDYPPELINITDEERKTKLFGEYQDLLVDCNTLLYAKRDHLTDMEKEGGIMKKFQISSCKSSIAKLEPLQDRVKKNLIAIDSKPSITMQEDMEERSLIKAIRTEIDNES